MVRKILVTIGYAACFYFVAYFLVDTAVQLNSRSFTLSLPLLSLAIFLSCICFIFQVIVWKYIFGINRCTLTYRQLFSLYCTAALTAYIPSKIPGIFITAEQAAEFGVRRVNSVISMVLFQIMSLVSAGFVGVGFALFASSHVIESTIIWALLFISPVILFGVLRCRVIDKIVNYLAIRVGKDVVSINANEQIKISAKSYLLMLVMFCGVWIFQVIIMSVLVWGVAGQFHYENIGTIGAAFLFSYLLGNLAIFLPSGMGVFEAGLFVGLKKILGFEQAMSVAALSRIVMVTPIIGCYISLKYIQRLSKKALVRSA